MDSSRTRVRVPSAVVVSGGGMSRVGVRARPRRDDAGAAAVEFALVSVVLFTLVFGVLQYGMLFFQLQAVSHAAREGARLAAVGVDDCAQFSTEVKKRGGPMADIATVAIDFSPGAVPGASADVAVRVAAPQVRLPVRAVLRGQRDDGHGISRVESVGGRTIDCPAS
jgi:Flp pilus assembly protein TadG